LIHIFNILIKHEVGVDRDFWNPASRVSNQPTSHVEKISQPSAKLSAKGSAKRVQARNDAPNVDRKLLYSKYMY